MQKEYLSAAAEVLSDQGVDENLGLSNDEASSRLAKTGPNKLEEAEKTPLWKRFFEQMADPMVIMLIVAAVISALTGMVKGEPDFADVAIIMFVVIVNSVLGVVQEAKSEEALEALQEMSAAQSKVLRDGKLVHLPSAELVPGDVIMLEAGDSVPADCRVLESATMKIEEAALTGESVPVEKHANVIELAAGTDDVPLGDRKNMCYMGSTVVYGRGRAVVVGTGMNTEMGKIAGALAEAKEELTPLQVKLAELSRILTIMVIVICVVIFGVDIIRHGVGNVLTDPTALLDTFMVAVSLAVAAIPEGLVAVVTIVLSLGVTKMAKRQAIIRKLSAVETLGCTQTICSDKTGTLTQNKMTVVKHELAAPKEKFLAGMALCSDAEIDADGVVKLCFQLFARAFGLFARCQVGVVKVNERVVIFAEAGDHALDDGHVALGFLMVGNKAHAVYKVLRGDGRDLCALAVVPLGVLAQVERPDGVIVVVLPAFSERGNEGAKAVGLDQTVDDVGDDLLARGVGQVEGNEGGDIGRISAKILCGIHALGTAAAQTGDRQKHCECDGHCTG